MNAMKKTFLMTVVSLPVLCAGTGAFAAMNPHGVAVLQALDKVTARVTEMEVPVGQAVEFGSLSIEVQACYKASRKTSPKRRPLPLFVTQSLSLTNSASSAGGCMLPHRGCRQWNIRFMLSGRWTARTPSASRMKQVLIFWKPRRNSRLFQSLSGSVSRLSGDGAGGLPWHERINSSSSSRDSSGSRVAPIWSAMSSR